VLSQRAVVFVAATASPQCSSLLLVQQWGLIMRMMLSSGSTLEVELVYLQESVLTFLL
jgi:hypothetical protein